MKNIKLSPDAEDDLENIWNYISNYGTSSAGKTLNNLANALDLISRFPYIGKSKHELLEGLRSFPIQKYIIYYIVTENNIEVLRIIHCALDPDKQFGNE